MSYEFDYSLDDRMKVIDDEGIPMLRVGMVFNIYYNHGNTKEKRESLCQCIDDYLAMAGENITYNIHPDTGKIYRFGEHKVPVPRDYFNAKDYDEPLEYSCHGGRDPIEVDFFSIDCYVPRDYNIRESSCFSITLPMSWFTYHEGDFTSLFNKYCEQLEPFFAVGGLGFIESGEVILKEKFEYVVFDWAKEFPGLIVDDTNSSSISVALYDGILSGNWLTALGLEHINKLGGMEALSDGLDGRFTLYPFKGGCVIKAGDSPEMGNASANDYPSEYVKLNKLLKPLRLKNHKGFHGPGEKSMNQQDALDWLARFDNVKED